ncbi:Hypothetical protein POVR1_LOCUS424 [uncultured virus]|nr:Hypothetical protein POVR1_LOCUS424 [uncultured virus]
MKWWNYARIIHPFTQINSISGTANTIYEMGTITYKFQSTKVESIQKIPLAYNGGIENFSIEAPKDLCLSVLVKLYHDGVMILDEDRFSRSFKWMFNELIGHDRIDVFNLIWSDFPKHQSELMNWAVDRSIASGSLQILSNVISMISIRERHLQLAIVHRQIEVLKLLLFHLTDPKVISRLPGILSFTLSNDIAMTVGAVFDNNSNTVHEIVKVLLNDRRTHDPDVLRGLLLVSTARGCLDIVDLLKEYVNDADVAFVDDIKSQRQRIERLEYLSTGIKYFCVILIGVALYQYWSN